MHNARLSYACGLDPRALRVWHSPLCVDNPVTFERSEQQVLPKHRYLSHRSVTIQSRYDHQKHNTARASPSDEITVLGRRAAHLRKLDQTEMLGIRTAWFEEVGGPPIGNKRACRSQRFEQTCIAGPAPSCLPDSQACSWPQTFGAHGRSLSFAAPGLCILCKVL